MALTNLEKMDELKSSLIKKLDSFNSLDDIRNFILNVTKPQLKTVVVNKIDELITQLQDEIDTVTTNNQAKIADLQAFKTEVQAL